MTQLSAMDDITLEGRLTHPDQLSGGVLADRFLVLAPDEGSQLNVLERVAPSHQFPVPAQDRVGSYDGRNLTQRLSAQSLAFDGQSVSLIMGQSDPLFAVSGQKRPDLIVLKLDDCFLLTLDPADEVACY